MTPQQFRKIALSLPDTVESEHMGHPDFRVAGKVFASLGAPSDEWGMVKLTTEQQQTSCEVNGDTFQPCSGAWGKQGYTNVNLAAAKTSDVRSALTFSVENVMVSPSKKKPASKPTPAKRKSKASTSVTTGASEYDDPAAVTALLKTLDHPLKPVIESIRATLLKADSRVTEGIKWNAPSACCHGWLATFHLRAKMGVVLVLHHGAKVRGDATLSETIKDPAKLLQWASADRAMIIFTSAGDFQQKQAALKSIIKQWVAFQIELANQK